VIIINPAMPPEQDRRRTERTQKRRKINAGVRSQPFSLSKHKFKKCGAFAEYISNEISAL
jgi:hypothetical protein